MKRRQFTLATMTALPLAALGQRKEATAERTNKPFVVKSQQSRFGEKTIVGASPNDIKVSAKDTNGDLTIFEYIGNDKGGPPLHIHHKQDEVFFILEGEYLFQVGDEKHNLKSGDTIFLPRTVPHTFAQLTQKGKMFYLFQPSGKMEDFFRKAGEVKGAPTPEEGAKLFADHDMQVVGPPLKF